MWYTILKVGGGRGAAGVRHPWGVVGKGRTSKNNAKTTYVCAESIVLRIPEIISDTPDTVQVQFRTESPWDGLKTY